MTKIDVAITGATGFVGRHLVQCLRKDGRSLRVLARDPSKLEHKDVEFVQGDLSSPPALSELCAGVRSVVHCAGLVMATTRQAFEEVNVQGTANMVAAAREAGVGRFVHLSSLAAREPGISDYAATKRAGEDLVASESGNMAWVMLRPPAIYGPGDKATLPLIKQLTQRIAVLPGSKSGRASLLHVEDLATALVALLERDDTAGQIYELDDGHRDGYSWEQMAQLSGKVQGRKVSCIFLPRPAVSLVGRVEQKFASWGDRMPQVTPGKTAELYHEDWVCRNLLLQDNSDWKPSISFEDGFEQTVAWYREAGWL